MTAVVTGGNGATSDIGYQVVEYPHIHRRQVVQAAPTRVKVLDVTVAPGLRVGYVMGVGDRCPRRSSSSARECTLIDAETLASRRPVAVQRHRARRARLRAPPGSARQQPAAARSTPSNGGTVIVQYQRTEFNEAQYGPYPAKTTSERVTDENAPIEILRAGQPGLQHAEQDRPGHVGGWVQERGTYFLGERDPRYVDLLRSRIRFPYNAGPRPECWSRRASGKGRWIYTGPRPVAAAARRDRRRYRLMANLAQPGKTTSA